MGKLLLVLLFFAYALSVGDVLAASDGITSRLVSGHGWTVTADERTETITVSHDRLSTVLEDAHLFVLDRGVRRALHGWRVSKETSDQITIETSEPQTFWRMKLNDDLLTVSSTANNGLMTAAAPVGRGGRGKPNRQAVHLLDTEGVPVTWVGTMKFIITMVEVTRRSHLTCRARTLM